MTGTARPATNRQIAKERTRQRLLDAALEILDEEGESGLTTTRITRLAGVSQPTFYVHFTDMDDLLKDLIQRLWEERRAGQRETRAEMRQATTGSVVRELTRATINSLVAHPAVLRLVMRSRLDQSSPLGEYTRAELDITLDNMITALEATGLPNATPAEQRKLRMQADGLVAVIDHLTLGHIEGRYEDVEEVLDVLMQFCRALTPDS